MMQTMRNSAKIVFFFVLIAFAGFMILQGLTSIFADPTQGGKAAPPGVIGIVDGVDIPITVFESAYRPRLRTLLQENEEPTEEQMEQIRNEIWNNLTTNEKLTVTDEYIKKYGHLLPSEFRGINAARVKANFIEILKIHPRMIRSLRRVGR